MAPHDGLVQRKVYDIKNSNVELIGGDIDHRLKHTSATTEPAWNDGKVGVSSGLFIWRIQGFAVVPIPASQHGQFFDGDSYIVLHSCKLGDVDKLSHDIFFRLGSYTSQDAVGVAAYKTVELDEFLHGAAVQHREIQAQPSEDFVAPFPRLNIWCGGVASGFRHIEQAPREDAKTLLRVFKQGRSSVVVHEVEPTWQSLDENDVFILDHGDKIYVWQGSKCSPMEKAKAAQVVHDMTIARHVNVEVLSQSEGRAQTVARQLGAGEDEDVRELRHERPIRSPGQASRPKRLFSLSDESGKLRFHLVKDGAVSRSDLHGDDVFILDDGGKAIWVWEGEGASKLEKAAWLQVAQAYVRELEGERLGDATYVTPIAKVREGFESGAFLRALEVVQN